MTKTSFKSSILAGLFAGLVAAVINAVLFFVFHAAGVITDDIFVQPEMPLTVLPVVISSLIPSLIASMVFYLVDRFTKNGFMVFTVISIVLLLFSFANPFVGIPGVTVGYAIALNAMHIVVVLSLLYFLKKASNSTKA